MSNRHGKGLPDNYRAPFLTALLLGICLLSYGQATYRPGTHVVVNDAVAPSQPTPLDARSLKYDSINFLYRPYNGTTEVLSYLNTPAYRTGQFLIVVDSGGILQSNGTYLGGYNTFYMFKDSTTNAGLVKMNLFGSGIGSCSGCLLAGNNLSDLQSLATALTNLNLNNVNNTSDAAKNAASVSLTNHTIDGSLNNLLNIGNASLAHSTIGLTANSNSGSDIQVTTTPASLGQNLVINFPSAGTASRGPLTSANWNFFNGKLDSVHVSNDSVYNCVNGTCTLQSVIAGTGGVNSVNGTNTSLLFSPSTGNVLGQVNPAYSFNWTGQHTFLSFAPIFSTLTTNSGIFYGNSLGQLLQTGAGTSAQIFESQGPGNAPIFFTPNSATVSGWLGYTPLSATLPSTQIYVGNGLNQATAVNMSGDATINNVGSVTNGGLKGNAIPSLAPGALTWNGAAWTFATYLQSLRIGLLDSLNKSSNGAVVSGNNLYLQTSDSLFPGLMTPGLQFMRGEKYWTIESDSLSTAASALTVGTGDTLSVFSNPKRNVNYGTSITAGVDLTSVYDDFAYRVAAGMGNTDIDLGIAGSTMVQLSPGDNSMQSRIGTIPPYDSTYGFLFFEYGVNDGIHMVDTNTFKTVYEQVIDSANIEFGWPLNKIVVLLPCFADTVTYPLTINYVNAARSVALVQGVPYVDLWHWMYLRGQYTLLNPIDKLHPNQIGHWQISNAIMHNAGCAWAVQGNIIAKGATFDRNLIVNNNTFLNNNVSIQGNVLTQTHITNGLQVDGSSFFSPTMWQMFNSGGNQYGFGIDNPLGNYSLNLYAPPARSILLAGYNGSAYTYYSSYNFDSARFYVPGSFQQGLVANNGFILDNAANITPQNILIFHNGNQRFGNGLYAQHGDFYTTSFAQTTGGNSWGRISTGDGTTLTEDGYINGTGLYSNNSLFVADSATIGVVPTGISTDSFLVLHNGSIHKILASSVGSGVTTVGTFSGSSQTNGASISGSTITFGPADATNPGMVTTGTQTIAGQKTFTGNVYGTHSLGAGSTPTTTSLGANVTSATVTGTDRFLQIVVVTSGAVSGTICVVTLSTTWPNVPIPVITIADATTGTNVSGTPGGYYALNGTTTTTLTMAGKFSSAATYMFNIMLGGN